MFIFVFSFIFSYSRRSTARIAAFAACFGVLLLAAAASLQSLCRVSFAELIETEARRFLRDLLASHPQLMLMYTSFLKGAKMNRKIDVFSSTQPSDSEDATAASAS